MMRAIAEANTRAPGRVTVTSPAATGATHAVCDAGYPWERKTNVRDAEWLCRLLDAGLPRASFVRPEPIRELRNLTRYCKPEIQERAREVNRGCKSREGMQGSNSFANGIVGKSGRDMLDALVAGTTEPAVLANLALRQCLGNDSPPANAAPAEDSKWLDYTLD